MTSDHMDLIPKGMERQQLTLKISCAEEGCLTPCPGEMKNINQSFIRVYFSN